MADQELRNRAGKLIGKIKTLPSGKLEGRDTGGTLKGFYEPKTNTTRDYSGRMVGKGNLLAVLVVS